MDPWRLVWIDQDGHRSPLMKVIPAGEVQAGQHLALRSIQLLLRPTIDGARMAMSLDPDASFLEALSITPLENTDGREFVVVPRPYDEHGGVARVSMLRLAVSCPLMPTKGGRPRFLHLGFTWDTTLAPVGAGQVLWKYIDIDAEDSQSQRFENKTLEQFLDTISLLGAYFTADIRDKPGPYEAPHLFNASALVSEPAAEDWANLRYNRRFSFVRREGFGADVYVPAIDLWCLEWHHPIQAASTWPGLWPLGIGPFGALEGEQRTDLHIEHQGIVWDAVTETRTWNLDAVARCVPGETFPVAARTPLAAWNRHVVDPYVRSLRAVKGGDPGSIVPRFDTKSDPETQDWRSRYTVDEADRRYRCVFLKVDVSPEWSDQDKSAKGIVAPAELPSFVNGSAAPIPRIFQLRSGSRLPAAKDVSENRELEVATPFASFSLRIDDQTEASLELPERGQTIVRVGALDLWAADPALASDRALSAGDGDSALFLKVDLRGLGDSEDPGTMTVDIDAVVRLWIEAFGAGGQDPTPLERNLGKNGQGPAVIIPSGADGARIPGPFILVAAESCKSGVSQSLALRLEKLPAALAPASTELPKLKLFVLQEHPFLVARVSADVALSGELEIGNWSGNGLEGPSWEITDRGGGFQLVLPPQVLGEEMLKRDADTDFLPSKSDVLYRFSPPASFQLARSAFSQQFSEAPWNLSRLLGYPGQRLPGMAAQSLEFELLYGLTTKVNTDSLRVAELEAGLGHLPPALSAKPGSRLLAYADLYANQLKILGSRVALIRPWTLSSTESVLTLEQGVHFNFRASRRCADPLQPAVHASLPYEEWLLRGGVDWGFESRNILDEVKNAPSTSGHVSGLAFSALGGTGFQKAVFNKSTVYSDTFLGRTFFYSLERIGRIGVHWNRAKYVVVYERSVGGSAQFPSPKDWFGVPMVRKVSEYVQVLQPERSYPDLGEAPKTVGFVLGSLFPKEPILVDGVWGRDVPGGWIIPLHHPVVPPLDPDKPDPADAKPGSAKTVYVAPDIALRIAVAGPAAQEPQKESGGGGAAAREIPSVWGHVLNPEAIYFYTSTNPADGVDTDRWPAAPGVDFPIREIPTITPGDRDATTSEGMLPDASSHHPGYEPFTLRIDTGGRPANLLAHRTDQATEALIENVTLARRSLSAYNASPDVVALKGALDRSAALASTVANITSLIVADAGIATGQLKNLDGQIKSLRDSVAATGQAYAAGGKLLVDAVQALRDRQQAAFDRHEAEWSGASEKLLVDLRKRLVELAKSTIAGDARVNEKREIAQRVFNDVTRQLQAIDLVHHDLANRASAAIATLNAASSRLKGVVKAEIAGLFPAVSTPTEIARAGVLAADRMVREVLEVRRQIATTAPHLWASLLESVQGAIAGLSLPGPPTAADATSLPAGAVDAAVAKLAAGYATALGKLHASLTQISSRTDEITKAYDALQRALHGEAGKIANFADGLLERAIDDAIKAARAKLLDGLGTIAKKLTTEDVDAATQLLGKLADFVDTIGPSLIFDEAAQIRAIIVAVSGLALRGRDVTKPLDAALERARQSVIAGVVGGAASVLAPFERSATEAAETIERALPGVASTLGAPTMRLLRAFGKAPVAEAMQLTRDRVAYYFHSAEDDAAKAAHAVLDAVNFTPATVLVNRVGAQLEHAALPLKSLGIRLPSFQIGDTFVPHFPLKIPTDLKGILPDFAGFRLEDLLGDIAFPTDQKDAVRITHGIEPASRLAWVQCDVAMPLTRDIPLFQLAPIELWMGAPNFKARTRVGASASGGVQRMAEASIRSHWSLLVAGQAVVTIRDAVARFDQSGRLSFEIGAQNIVVHEALRFLTELLAAVKPGGDTGLAIDLLRKEGALPYGVRARLGLALPAIQSGAFSISNLSIQCFLEIAMPKDFEIAAGFSLASKDRPFNLSVLFLGGGGWLTVGAHYRPFQHTLSASLSIGIAAGAAVPFDIGVASGSVYFLVSLGVEWSSGSSGGLTILLRAALSGELQILGLISVNVIIALEARYQTGGALLCVGTIRVKIKICWFIKIDLSAGFTLTLAGKSPTQAQGPSALAAPTTPQQNYVDSFGGW